MFNFLGWFALWFCLWASPLTGAPILESKPEYLSRVNAELNFWDGIVLKEQRAAESENDDGEKGKILSDLELQIRDLRGDLLKLRPAGEEVWQEMHPRLERDLARLRDGFRDVH